MITPRKKLTDICPLNSDLQNLRSAWANNTPEDDETPLPEGVYTFRIREGKLATSKKGTPSYKVTLEVTEGDHEGHFVWHDFWLTEKAMKRSRRDLAKIGINQVEDLEKPLPMGILIQGKVTTERLDDGTEHNRLGRFKFLEIEKSDAFEAPEVTGTTGTDFPGPEQSGIEL